MRHIYSIATFPALLFLFLLWGCSERPLTFQVRFDEVAGLEETAAVYFKGNQIGLVKRITYTEEGNYLVTVAVNPDFKNAVTADSTFFVDYAPTHQRQKGVMVLQSKPGGIVLQHGSIVQGAGGSGYLDTIVRDLVRIAGIGGKEIEKALAQLQNTLDAASLRLNMELADRFDVLSRQLQEINREVQKVPDSEAIQQLEEAVSQFAEAFNRANAKVREYMRNEVIPQLHIELEKLRELLHQQGREKEMEEIDKRMQEMV